MLFVILELGEGNGDRALRAACWQVSAGEEIKLQVRERPWLKNGVQRRGSTVTATTPKA